MSQPTPTGAPPAAAQSPLATPHAWNLVAPAYAQEVVPLFERFAAEALRLAAPAAGARVLDVACGPGTLALLAARTASRVVALDFSPAMIERLRARLQASGIGNVEPREGDGQALPFGDGEFDAGFSMFGLMFFPDRARGLAELHRVVRPGGTVVISSWQPFEKTPPFPVLFEAVREALPGLPFGQGAAPLGDRQSIEAELGAAGFSIEVQAVTFPSDYPSADEAYSSLERTMAPLVLLQHRMGAEAWRPVSDRIRGRMVAAMGPGPVTLPMHAWLSVGRR
jgi:SAM-dependent methyltransferase